MSHLNAEDSDYDSLFGDGDEDDHSDAGSAVAATATAALPETSIDAETKVAAVDEMIQEPKTDDGGSDSNDYDSMFEDNSSDDGDNDNDDTKHEKGMPPAHNGVHSSQVHSQEQNHSSNEIIEPTKEPSSDEDFDDMFGEESSNDDEPEVVRVDIHKTIIPRRKRKFGQDPRDHASSEPNEKRPSSSAAQSSSNSASRTNFPSRIFSKRRRPDQYKHFDMDDFWRTLRSWDFVTELNQSMKRDAQNDESSSISKNNGRGLNAEPLPDEFHCPEEYIARWAPLQIQETKAQILAEMSSNRTVSYQTLTVPVQVTPKKDNKNDSYSECIWLNIAQTSAPGSANNHMSNSSRTNSRRSSDSSQTDFLPNDLILLTCDSSIVEQAYKGILRPPDKSSYSMTSLLSLQSPFVEGRLAVVGTVTQRCRNLDSLVIQVSRRLWKPTSMGPSELFLLRLGSNITAVREFRALCGIKDMPLSKYLSSDMEEIQRKKRAIGSHTTTKDPLSQCGGSNALGIGFRIFIKSKFNTSQQAAISAAAREYGDGGFTLVKGPPGTGKTTTIVALLNALHLKQYQKYYSKIEQITLQSTGSSQETETLAAISAAAEVKPRILVCAPSNAAVDNIILKIVQDRFLDGNGSKYSPSIIRIGSGQSSDVASVALDEKVNKIIAQGTNITQLETTVRDTRKELKRLQNEIRNLQLRVRLISNATKYPLSRDWEIRVDEQNFEKNKRVMYVNHKTKKVQLTCPSRPNVGEEIHPTDQMPHYRGCMSSLVRYIERHNDLHSKLLQLIQIQNFSADMGKSKRNSALTIELHQNLETNVLDSTHIVMTTLGTSGSKTLERINNFSVIVVDEAAQSCEPSMLPALQLGSQHCVLVGDPQQLPATIFSMSGRSTKYDRSLFQRLEEAGHHVYMLNTQYRMNPMISSFPRRIFYDGSLVDGPNVTKPDYGSDLTIAMRANFRQFQPLTVFDIDSKEERDGTSLYNKTEAHLALHLFTALRETAQIKSRVAIITPYQQQVAYLRRIFQDKFGLSYPKFVDVSTVDAFQGKESSIVILSCVRASAEGGGIGFLSDVQRMNVALTRAKHFLFVLARCESIVVNPYWRDFIDNAREQGAVLRIAPRRTNHHNGGVGRGSNGPPMTSRGGRGGRAGGRDSKRGNGNDLYIFPDLRYIQAPPPSRHLQHF